MRFNPGQVQQYLRSGFGFTGATAATGVAPGTAIGTTAAFSLYNPSTSGLVAIPLVVSCGYISGTLGAGVVWYLQNVTATATTGTAITVSNCRTDSTRTAGTIALLTTATIPSPVILRPAFGFGASLASTAVAPWLLKDEPMGEFLLYPGSTLSLHATAAAGSTPLVSYGCTFLALPA